MAPDVFRHLVAPTDFSDCAEAAWGLAQRVAQKLGSEIVLTHVFVAPPVYGDPPGVVAVVQVLVEAEKWVADELQKWAEEARKRGMTVRTHGRGGVSRALLGSVADRVIRTAPCPVLTVRKPE